MCCTVCEKLRSWSGLPFHITWLRERRPRTPAATMDKVMGRREAALGASLTLCVRLQPACYVSSLWRRSFNKCCAACAYRQCYGWRVWLDAWKQCWYARHLLDCHAMLQCCPVVPDQACYVFVSSYLELL